MNTTLFFYLVHPLVALFASVGYAIVCNAPRKEIPYCGLTAFLCWLVYQLVLRHDGSSFLATLLATFAATGFARFLSYHRMLPTIVYHIPGILPLVPGAAVYRCITSAMESRVLETTANILTALKLAGAIGIGMTLLILLPGNAILHSLTGQQNINAALPATSGLILVALSTALTMLGGLIPSRSAAKCNPVIALRAE